MDKIDLLKNMENPTSLQVFSSKTHATRINAYKYKIKHACQKDWFQKHLFYPGQGCLQLHSRRPKETGGVLGDTMFLHTTPVAIEEHVVHLFLVLSLQLFLLNSEHGPEFL